MHHGAMEMPPSFPPPIHPEGPRRAPERSKSVPRESTIVARGPQRNDRPKWVARGLRMPRSFPLALQLAIRSFDVSATQLLAEDSKVTLGF